MDEFTKSYIACALWSTNDESDPSGGAPLDDNYTVDDIHPDSLATMINDCKQFQSQYSKLLDKAYGTEVKGYVNYIYDASHAGHDLWLARNGHGVGFWDRGLGEVGEQLSEACGIGSYYDSRNLYIGDDKLIHQA